MNDNCFDSVPNRTPWRNTKQNYYRDTDIIPMWVADMDFASAEPIIEDLREILRENSLVYSEIPEQAFEAVMNRQEKKYGLKLKKESVLFLPGLVVGLNVVSKAFYGLGMEESLTLTPIYPPFLTAPKNQGVRNLCVDAIPAGNSWEIDFDALNKEVTPHTRFLQLCNPHNPIGRLYQKKELEALGEFCLEKNLWIVSDEVHMDLILKEDLSPTPLLAMVPELADRTVVMGSASKAFNIAGCSCAYFIVPDPKMKEAILAAMRGIVPRPNAFGIQSMISAYTKGEPWLQELIPYLKKNSDYLIERIRDMGVLRVTEPQEATYLSWVDASGLGCEKPAKFFEENGLGVSDGTPFGNPQFVRINFGCTFSVLKTAMDRLEAAVKKRREQLSLS